jgi:hypothetical protein
MNYYKKNRAALILASAKYRFRATAALKALRQFGVQI